MKWYSRQELIYNAKKKNKKKKLIVKESKIDPINIFLFILLFVVLVMFVFN